MPITDKKIQAFAKKVSDLADKPTGSAAEIKVQFDAAPEELRVAHNGLIEGIVTDYALKSELNGVVLGQIPDGSLTYAKLDTNNQAAISSATIYAYKNLGGF